MVAMVDLSEDLRFAHSLASVADQVSMRHFRSEALRVKTKGDGTPVSQVDQAVEKAMLQVVLSQYPNDALLGEEIGPIPGSNRRRWIFDGIDGTHNYTLGYPGWATVIALEVAGQIRVGVVSSPALGKRWWAEKDGGAWAASIGDDGEVDPDLAVRMQCASADGLDVAKVVVTPFEGMLLGWRSDLAGQFVAPTVPRSQCFALDAVKVAAGELDAVVVMLGGVWDFAATSRIVAESGGAFRDAWGGHRLDTASAVFAAPTLIDSLLDVIGQFRPPTPDEARLASTVRRPNPSATHHLTEPQPHATTRAEIDYDWTGFGIRPLPSMSARVHVLNMPPPILDIVDERAAHLANPFVGVTNDGTVRSSRAPVSTQRVSTEAITQAAQIFLQGLTAEQRARTEFPMDSTQWRTWINVHMNLFRHGLMLEDLPQSSRDDALDILRATLSIRGFDQARTIMRVNELVAELTGDRNAFGEWPYFMSIFGSPGGADPWGWQIDGHHLNVNCVVFNDRIVMTPTFMGSEPRRINQGPMAGTSLFDPEEALGLELMRSFDSSQAAKALIYPSIHPEDLPPSLQNIFDGRMQAGAFHDNVIAPYQGVSAVDLSDAQRRVLLQLAGTYVGWSADNHAEVRMTEVEAHLDETWFSWYGQTGDHSPFYYRVHSPVILVEFDHHPGVVFDNDVPSRHHVHTLVRTPHGRDYGTDLLRQHHEQFDHSRGSHELR